LQHYIAFYKDAAANISTRLKSYNTATFGSTIINSFLNGLSIYNYRIAYRPIAPTLLTQSNLGGCAKAVMEIKTNTGSNHFGVASLFIIANNC
jgi:hypothetical protein